MKIGLIGLGRIGKMHRDLLQGHFPGIHLKTCVDERASQFPSEENVSPSLEAIENDPEIKAVVIATPSPTHISLAHRMLQKGKHVLCEKPFGISFPELESFHKEWDNHPTRPFLQVGFNRRFDPGYLRLRKMIQEGHVGELRSITIFNRDPGLPSLDFLSRSGGLFLDFAIHDFDMIRFLTQSEGMEIFTMGGVLVNQKVRDYGDIDTAVTSLRLQNGAIVSIHNSRESLFGYDQRCEVLGSKGAYFLENVPTHSVHYKSLAGTLTANPHPSFEERYKEGYFLQMEYFLQKVFKWEGGDRSWQGFPSSFVLPAGLEDTLAAHRLAQAAGRSLKEGKTVFV